MNARPRKGSSTDSRDFPESEVEPAPVGGISEAGDAVRERLLPSSWARHRVNGDQAKGSSFQDGRSRPVAIACVGHLDASPATFAGAIDNDLTRS